jgi:hypothetical protein
MSLFMPSSAKKRKFLAAAGRRAMEWSDIEHKPHAQRSDQKTAAA